MEAFAAWMRENQILAELPDAAGRSRTSYCPRPALAARGGGAVSPLLLPSLIQRQRVDAVALALGPGPVREDVAEMRSRSARTAPPCAS